jgi:putative acyl-CoA dehydrogenase
LAAFLRLALPAAKFWVCKRAPAAVGEALECLGGNGYVEDSGLPRLYRDAPLNSIWEGSGNITALDVLRALSRGPEPAGAVLAEIGQAAGADRRLDAAAGRLRAGILEAAAAGPAAGHLARRLAGQLTVILQASLLTRFAPPAVADAFCATRLDGTVANGAGGPGTPFGSLPAGLPLPDIIARSSVAAAR